MCPLPGPTHQSLTRNMPPPRARSHFSPYHSIKATLPSLMEGGKNTLVIFHQSHRQYIPSHHIEGAQMDVVHVVVICPPLLDDLTDLKLACFQIVQVTIGVIWKGKVKSIRFIFCLILQSHARIVPIIETLNSAHPLRSNVTVNYCRMTHKSGLDLINSNAWLIAMLICRTGAEGSEEMCVRNSLSLLRSSEWPHCVIFNSNKTRANVKQETGKYLIGRDYSESQMNNIVFRNMCSNLKAISPAWLSQ